MMEKNIKSISDRLNLKSYSQDIFGDDDEINPLKIFIKLFGEIADRLVYYHSVNLEQFIAKLKEEYNISKDSFIAQQAQIKDKDISKIDYDSYFTCLIVMDEGHILYIDKYKLAFFYSSNIDTKIIHNIIALAKSFKKQNKHKKKFYMIAESIHFQGFELRKFKIKPQQISLDDNYNDDFKEVDIKIRDFLNKKKSNGLILLHGKYGTGKTSYIRYLMNEVNKRFILLPVNMMSSISSPNFLPFMSQYKNSTLILEDCESILKQRDSNNTDNALINLLNLGDGLLSDALSIKIICTFNTELKNIDRAILRKGRLATQYEFKELSIEKTENLCNKLEIKDKPKATKTLAEIYNMGDNVSTNNNFEQARIGF